MVVNVKKNNLVVRRTSMKISKINFMEQQKMKWVCLFFLLLSSTKVFAFTPEEITALENAELSKMVDNMNNKTKMLIEGKVITINTGDRPGCLRIREELNLNKEVCHHDKVNPFVSIIIARAQDDRDYFEKKIEYEKLSTKQKIALKSTGDLLLMGAGMIGIIYSLPESVSKWDKTNGFSNMAGRWKERVNSGPVIDRDDWAVNFIGHPISGAAYYTMVRHQGYSALQAAGFSFCMSTFFWEYGLEAFAEIPSIQDLILTPLVGSILGETFYQLSLKIQANDEILYGSRALGRAALILMNPAGELANQINRVAKYDLIKNAKLSVVNRPSISMNPIDGSKDFSKPNYIGLELKMAY